MAVQVLSDLHLEAFKSYDIFEIVPRAPYLALLGDIANVARHKDAFLAFLARQLAQFRAVLFIPGNHEAYGSSWPDTIGILRDIERQFREDSALGEFVLLDRTIFRIPETNTVILGCSLFSFIPPESQEAVSMGLSDFYQIDNWSVEAHNQAHARDVAWLNEQVTSPETSGSKIMVFSHWSPTRDARASAPRHAGSSISSGFLTDLSAEACFRSDRVKLWAFGHTHFNCDFLVEREGGVKPLRILTNQYGYYFAQAEGFDGEKVAEV